MFSIPSVTKVLRDICLILVVWCKLDRNMMSRRKSEREREKREVLQFSEIYFVEYFYTCY